MWRTKVLWCVAAMMLCAAPVAMAEDDLSVGVAADFFSKYVWRGQNVVDDWVLQPGVSVGYKGFTGSIWANMDLAGDVVGSGELNEVDYAVDYSNTVPGQEILGFSVGLVYYDFPNTASDGTTEFYAGLSADVTLSPAVTWYYDFDEADGSYVQFSIGHTIERIASWGEDRSCDLELGAGIGYGTGGYNNYYFGVDDGAFNDLTLSAGVPFTFGSLTIKPGIAYSTMLDEDLRASQSNSDNLWGGIGLSYSF